MLRMTGCPRGLEDEKEPPIPLIFANADSLSNWRHWRNWRFLSVFARPGDALEGEVGDDVTLAEEEADELGVAAGKDEGDVSGGLSAGAPFAFAGAKAEVASHTGAIGHGVASHTGVASRVAGPFCPSASPAVSLCVALSI